MGLADSPAPSMENGASGRIRFPRLPVPTRPRHNDAVLSPALSPDDAMRYWLLKTEPDSFSIDDLAQQPNQTTDWSGVRNYQARNYMRDDMQLGDRVLFYHSSTTPPAIVGTAKIVKESYPDHTSWDKRDHHYDPDSSAEKPRWFMVDIQLESKFTEPLTLEMLKQVPALAKMELLRKGSRLSVQPVTKEEFETVMKLASGAQPTSKAAAPKKTAKKATAKVKAAKKKP